MIQLSSSILSADFCNLERDIAKADAAGSQMIHVDVMDGHFVPNITIGAPVTKAIRSVTGRILDVHLMIEHPDRYLPDFIEAGADFITVHLESEGDTLEQVKTIRRANVKAGVAIKPGTKASELFPLLPHLDMALVMTVEPGFGGQGLIESCVDKVRLVRGEIALRGYDCLLQIDGGAKLDNIEELIVAGADVIVAGSAVFSGDIQKNVKAFLDRMKQAEALAPLCR